MQAFLVAFQDMNGNVWHHQLFESFFRKSFSEGQRVTALVNNHNSEQLDKMTTEHAHPKVYLFGKELFDKEYCLTELLVFK